MSFLADIAATPATPQLETLAEARAKVDPGLTLDEYTLARMVYSEHARGSAVELCCLADAGFNKARADGSSLYQYATGGLGFGGQGGARQVSTARAPTPRHIKAALAVLRRRPWMGIPGLAPPPARGIARGARRFFDPRAQLALHRQDPVKNCPPLAILERWCFGKPWFIANDGERARARAAGDPRGCALSGAGRPVEEWVGPIEGVDPYELMLLRPASALHASLYREARRVIESLGSYKGSAPGAELGDIALVVIGLGIAAAAAGGIA